MVGPKKKDFWPKINIGTQMIPLYFENTGAPVHQKLNLILDSKVVQKLKLGQKYFFTKNGLLN